MSQKRASIESYFLGGKKKLQKIDKKTTEESEDKSCIFYGHQGELFDNTNSAIKVAAFDLDSTIITTISGNTFPKDKFDWKLFSPNVKSKLKQLVCEDFKIIFVTNQNGISKGKISKEDFLSKVDEILERCGPEVMKSTLTIIATEDNIYRKPCTAGWDYLFSGKKKGSVRKLDMGKSFYCGDAAGRLATKGMKKDFSDSDLKFALNLGLRFCTPENFFKGKDDTAKIQMKDFDFDPRVLEISPENEVKFKTKLFGNKIIEKPELIILIGSPGSGKSTVCARYFSNYVHVNQDTLKTKQKCMEMCKKSLTDGKSAIVDAQNKKTDLRAEWIQFGKHHGAKSIRCVFIDMPKEFSMHMNRVRSHCNEKSIPKIVINMFYKQLDNPTVKEGFDDIIKYTLNDFSLLMKETTMTPSKKKMIQSFI